MLFLNPKGSLQELNMLWSQPPEKTEKAFQVEVLLVLPLRSFVGSREVREKSMNSADIKGKGCKAMILKVLLDIFKERTYINVCYDVTGSTPGQAT